MRQTAILLSLLVLGCGRIGFDAPDVSICAAELAANAPYATGAGTASDPYWICSPAQLAGLADRPADLGESFILMADLDFEGVSFSGIGSRDAPFTGDIDGNGHTISNLTVIGVPGEPVGFVNAASAAHIRNIALVNVTIAGTGSVAVGAVMGYCDRAQARNATVSGADVWGDGSVGGLVGYADDCQILGATLSAVAVAGTVEEVGGVAGTAHHSIILNVDLEVELNAPSAAYVGGVVGLEGWSPLIIQGVSVRGDIVGNEDVGGILGLNGDGAHIYRSSFTGSILGNSGVGGVVGGNYDSPFHVYSTSVNADITGTTSVGGFSGHHYYRSRFFDSHFTGTITGAGSNQAGFGGFFGDVEYYGWVERSYVDVTIDSQSSTVGGFLGYIGYWSGSSDVYDIADSFSVANVSGSSASDTISPWVGENIDPNPFVGAGSYYWSGATCVNAGGGECGSGGMSVADVGQFQDPTAAPLSSWDFDEVWESRTGAFPTPRIEQLHAPTVIETCSSTAIVGLQYDCDLVVSDADANEERVAILDTRRSCGWLSATIQSFYGAPTAEDPASCTVEFTVTDGVHETAVESFPIEVHAGVVMTPANPSGVDHFMGFETVGSPGVVEILTLTNNESVPVTGLSVSGLPAGDFSFDGDAFPGTGGTCGAALEPAGTCTVAIRYTPTVADSVAEAIAINFTAARGPVSYAFTLSGYGT